MSLITTLKLMKIVYLMHKAVFLFMHGGYGEGIAHKATSMPVFWRLFKRRDQDGIWRFFSANRELWEYLEMKSNISTDIKHYIPNTWCLNFSVCSDIPNAVASQVLEAVAFKLGRVAIGPPYIFFARNTSS
ncbi:hypothetical protein Moror_5229 [Moniliophthora roreri MCA 2997]|uniref:Uncharacterized protein n=1 Tax=Moniliophthora roreri (strain MCA 2997) TaxID=1381753 RepID=V2X5Z5_MONRO|nr:hypothetical protein Moror_5229 [Moniliophthora roreri MCA 2997]